MTPSTLTKNIDATVDITNTDIQKDTHHVHMDETYVMIIRYTINVLGLLWLPLLSSQMVQAQELKRDGSKSKNMGAFTVFYVIFALCWSVMVNIMSIYSIRAPSAWSSCG